MAGFSLELHRAQGAEHRAQGMELRVQLKTMKIRLHTGSQGEMGTFTLSPFLLVSLSDT